MRDWLKVDMETFGTEAPSEEAFFLVVWTVSPHVQTPNHRACLAA